jgi:hypothetical protein
MVQVVDFKIRTSESGETFLALILESDLDIVKSGNGNMYATAKRCSIPSTFNAEGCKRLVGKTIPGKIIKEESEPYQYTVPETGEVITLAHRYKYSPVETPQPQMEEAIFEIVEPVPKVRTDEALVD